MPEIEISDSQREYLEGLRTHIAEEHVGPYGHVRTRDVVQFLIDRHEQRSDPDREAIRDTVRDHLSEQSYQELQSLAADTEGVEPGGKAPDLRERLVDARVRELLGETEEDDEPTAGGADRGGESGAKRIAAVEETSDADRSKRANGAVEETQSGGDVETTGSVSDSGAESGGGVNSDGGANSDGNAVGSDADADSGGSRLQRMMGLLDQNEDKWEERESDEGKYAVTLPDGSVESARTKDDIRSLLFKHYD